MLDAPAEASFDRLVKMVASQLEAPVALMSVIDRAGDRQFFKSSLGLPEPWATARETPLSHSFCQRVADDGDPLIVNDARTDVRMADNPAVGAIGVVAYLGVPVVDSEGHSVGALCAIDARPRVWTDEHLEALRSVADMVSGQIRLRQALRAARIAQRNAEQAATALAEANRRFEDLAANVPGAIFRYVAQASGRSVVDYMSPGCVDIWEIPADDVVEDAARLWAAVHPDDLADMAASVNWSAETLSPWRHRWRVRTPSGRMKWLQGYGQPRSLEDGSTLWNSLILDVTVEVVAQQRLTENTRMLQEAQKQESIGRIAGGIAHDFNNLLYIILGNAELLLDGAATDPAPFLEEIKAAALRGDELTRRLLGFARRSELKPAVLDANQAIAGMHNLLRRTLPESITIETSLMAGLWRIRADQSFLESTLLNLVVNARDAMAGGGSLTIETANMRVTEEYIDERGEDMPPGRYVMIAVTDTGEGIDPALLGRIFEPFFTTKGPDKGSGLGLAMAHGFAKQSGGTIRVYSERGRGASFKIYLPAVDDPEAPETSRRGGDLLGGSAARILLVEDQAPVRRVSKLMLESVGHSVLEAASGDAALRVFEAGPDDIDLIVTDVVMPGRLQGPELVAAARRVRGGLPAIYVSGYPHEANVHGNGIRPDDASLTKPLERDALLIAVQRALRRAR